MKDAIAAAERVLPGKAAPEGQTDPRWQAIIKIGEFVETEPIDVWDFAARWGSHDDVDLRAAVATCLLEHLLEYHFDEIFPKAEALARTNRHFAATLGGCWKFGQLQQPVNAKRFDQLLRDLQNVE